MPQGLRMLHYLAKDLNLATEHSPCMAMGQASELPYVAGRDVDIFTLFHSNTI